MNSGRIFGNVYFLVAGVIISLVFVGSSLVTIYHMEENRNQIKDNSKLLQTLSSIEKESIELTKSIDEANRQKIQHHFNVILGKANQLEPGQLKDSINDILLDINRRPQYFKSLEEMKSFARVLLKLAELCQSKIAIYNESNSAAFLQLNALAWYSNIINLVACVLAILVGYSAFVIFKVKDKVYRLNRRTTGILDNSFDSIILTDIDGNISEFNQAAEREFRVDRSSIIGKNVSELYADESDYQKVIEHLKDEGIFRGEVTNINQKGEVFLSDLTASVLRDEEGQMTGSMGISRNITEQKQIENDFRYLTEQAVDMIYLSDLQGVFTYANEASVNVMGYSKEEILGTPFTQWILEEDVEMVVEQYRKQFQERLDTSYFEFRMVKKEGGIIWIGQTVRTIFDVKDSQRIKGFQGIARDISRRKEIEMALERSQANFEQIANTITDVFFLYDLLEKKYRYISPNCNSVLGVSEQDLYDGFSFNQNKVHVDDQRRANDSIQRARFGMNYDVQYRIHHGESIVWIQEKGFPIKDSQGNVIAISGTCRDITRLKNSNERILKKNIKIAESIHYAKKIQDSTLPNMEQFSRVLPNGFVFFSPKDVVSGDFYMVEELDLGNGEKAKVILLGDCTGHGVPGSILSLLCIAILKEFLTVDLMDKPADILEGSRRRINNIFQSSQEHHIHDGMDLAVGIFHEGKNKLYFAGANMDSCIIRNGEVSVLKGNRQHIGYSEHFMPFTAQEVQLQKGDHVYFYSDGYADQFGGPRNKKFMKGRLKELLVEQSKNSLEDQYENFKDIFFEWKGENTHTDDVTLIGVRL